jgi:hypothetical protein
VIRIRDKVGSTVVPLIVIVHALGKIVRDDDWRLLGFYGQGDISSLYADGVVELGALATFVKEHDLHCFRCGAEKAEWAKTGVSKRGAWAVFLPHFARLGWVGHPTESIAGRLDPRLRQCAVRATCGYRTRS